MVLAHQQIRQAQVAMVQHIKTVRLGGENLPAARLELWQQSGKLLRVHLAAGPRLQVRHKVRKVVGHEAQSIAAAEDAIARW